MKKEKIILTICIFVQMFAHGQGEVLPSAKLNLDQVREVAINSAKWSMANHLTNMSYQNMCAAYGILKVADVVKNDMLRKGIEDALHPELLENKYPHRDNALKQPPHRWFGFIPFELYKQTKNPSYLKRGIEMADEQYIDADKYGMPGYTPRVYVDDIYGATVLQSLAYSCTEDLKYLNRAIQQVLFYSGNFMQDNGLFHHSPKSRYFWGRGNGWCAAAYPELLSVMPEDHPMRETVLIYYRRMMAALLKYHGPEGMWYQLLDDHKSWPETSSTAMFIFAMGEGVRNGWLPVEPYGTAVVKAWNALKEYVDPQWRIREVCAGTGFGDREYYLNRPRLIGDPHGQAPLLWAASAILKMYK
jgi:unsaturated rhamnogalacturonyl hydrolase